MNNNTIEIRSIYRNLRWSRAEGRVTSGQHRFKDVNAVVSFVIHFPNAAVFHSINPDPSLHFLCTHLKCEMDSSIDLWRNFRKYLPAPIFFSRGHNLCWVHRASQRISLSNFGTRCLSMGDTWFQANPEKNANIAKHITNDLFIQACLKRLQRTDLTTKKTCCT